MHTDFGDLPRQSDKTACGLFDVETFRNKCVSAGDAARTAAALPWCLVSCRDLSMLVCSRFLRPARLCRAALGLALPVLAACQAQLDVDLDVRRAPAVQALRLALPTVTLIDKDEATHVFDTSRSSVFDLYGVEDGTLQSLLSMDDAAAHYRGVSLQFDLDGANLNTDDGKTWPLTLLAQGDVVDIDFKLDDTDSKALVLSLELPFSLIDRRSSSEQDFALRPVLRAALASEAAEISGTIARSAVEADDCRAGRSVGTGIAVYLYSGTDVTPTDYYRSDSVISLTQPLASARAQYDASDDAYRFTIAQLAPGDYTLSWTCQADGEHPDADDGLQFRGVASLSVSASDTSSLTFTE